jgi:NAD(P)-dependent dehydrogenase (short-subunit alcohol dehydrogenase family)
MTLSGRVAVITGAGHGMGAAHARELANRGAKVGLGDVDLDAAEQVAHEIRLRGGSALACECDVRSAESVKLFVTATAHAFDGVDIAISNAGIGDRSAGIEETEESEWHEQFAVHVDGAFHLARAALPWLKHSGQGRIVLVSSEWAQRGPGVAHGYCAAKGALLALGRNLAVELAAYGIRVNSIAPGTIATRMTADEDLESVAAQIPLGRVGRPEDVSRLVAFLSSAESDFITGQTIPINGGAVISGS